MDTMEIVEKVIKKHLVPNITAEREEFRRMFEDMRRSAGLFTPAATWLVCQHPENIESNDLSSIVDAADSDEMFDREFSDLQRRMDGWVGIQTAGISDPRMAKIVSEYAALFSKMDGLGLWQANVENPAIAASLKVADLGSMMDLNFLYSYSFDGRRKLTRILEIGGGYGRIAEAAFNVFGKSIRYVLVDSVPASLYYAKKYMEQACPEIRVGSYYDGDAFDLNNFECYIIPSWYFEKMNRDQYDVCINTESFQEMNQEHVDTYLNLFDRVTVDGATIYVSNAHDYIFRGQWNYPAHWQKVLCANTPRSWSLDHPTEIFVKGKSDFSVQNDVLDGIHTYLVSRNGAASLPEPITLGDQVERLAGKRVRSAMRGGMSLMNRVVGKLAAMRR